MRLTLAAFIHVQRESGRNVHVCQSLRGSHVSAQDPLLRTALSKLGNKMRKAIGQWIEAGAASRIGPWLYDSDLRTRICKLTLVLRDRTVRWKLLLVYQPAFERLVAFSPSIPDVVFEVQSVDELEDRAIDVYTAWAQDRIADERDLDVPQYSDMWVEPLEVDIDPTPAPKRKSRNALAAMFGGERVSGSEELHTVGQCLDDLVGDFDPTLGRDEIVDELSNVLNRDDRQGVLIVGPPAVGKTSIVQQCVRDRAARFADLSGAKPQTWWLSPQRLISGMSYLGQWEQRWLAILREATKRDHILYFDDLVGLFTAGRTRDSSLTAADVLRGYLSENKVRILAEATDQQLAILRRRDRALIDRLHLIRVAAWSPDDALPVVLRSAYHLQQSADRHFHPATIPLVMRHQELYAPDKAFPGKAIDMLKTLAKHADRAISPDVFYSLAGTQVGANMQLMLGSLGDQEAIRNSLERQLIGQPEAVDALSRIVVRFSQHLQPLDRPLGVLLFLGPTGVGKTESAKAVTRLLYRETPDDSHLIRIDMNELTNAMAAEQLVGTFDQPEGRLTAAVRRRPNCVILLDEIEKAHPDVFDYLLQVIGEGRLTDARGRVADFRSAIIIMTSNLGATEQATSLGFDASESDRGQRFQKAAKDFFRPEFFNRIDEVIAFRRLGQQDMEKIVRLQMRQVLSRDGLVRRDAFVDVAESAIEHVIRSGFDPQFGARSVRRKLEQEIIGPLGDCLAGLTSEQPVLVHVSGGSRDDALKCQTTPMRVASTRPYGRLRDIDVLFEQGGQLYQRLDERLTQLQPQLLEQDQAYGERTHNTSYYVLREQLYHCNQWLTAARLRKESKSLPLPSIAPGANRRPPTVQKTAVKRALVDWQVGEELLAELDDSESSGRFQSLSDAEFTKSFIDSFAIAENMIQSALTARHWLLGIQSLSPALAPFQPTSSKFRVGPQDVFSPGRDRLLDIEYNLVDTDDPSRFVARLVACLKHVWHYDIGDRVRGNYWRVSGVALYGLLKSILGCYRFEFAHAPTSLGILRAIPVSQEIVDADDPALVDQYLSSSVLSMPADAYQSDAAVFDVLPPGSQPVEGRFTPRDTIRGCVTEEALEDYISGSRQVMPTGYWVPAEKLAAATADWWTSCLSIPSQLQRVDSTSTPSPDLTE